jgi:hypothetical protein
MFKFFATDGSATVAYRGSHRRERAGLWRLKVN